ncbi:MAG: DsrE family protein [Alphaproteobacteria bacterium]|jgi:peroxiredoxin family protein|nr:DsrE family protein [Alphaproteobacteria bacterium]
MPPEESGTGPDGLALIIQSDGYDKVHYALATASAAAAVGRPVILFFAMGAVRALVADQGWQRLESADGRAATDVDAGYRGLGIADLETLLGACVDLGVRFMVCEMGLLATGLKKADLRTDVTFETGGLATLMLEAGAGNIVFV